MQKRRYVPGVAILSVIIVGAFAVSDSALAKVKKLSYEDAFAKCKQEIGARSGQRKLEHVAAVFFRRRLHEAVWVGTQEIAPAF